MKTHSLQQQFSDLATELHQHYQTVQAAIEQIDAKQIAAPSVELLSQINALLTPVKETESRLAPVRDQLIAAGESTPADVKPIIEQTVQIVSYLLPKIGELEKSAQQSRDNLAPKIGESVRAMRMQSAYSRKR